MPRQWAPPQYKQSIPTDGLWTWSYLAIFCRTFPAAALSAAALHYLAPLASLVSFHYCLEWAKLAMAAVKKPWFISQSAVSAWTGLWRYWTFIHFQKLHWQELWNTRLILVLFQKCAFSQPLKFKYDCLIETLLSGSKYADNWYLGWRVPRGR